MRDELIDILNSVDPIPTHNHTNSDLIDTLTRIVRIFNQFYKKKYGQTPAKPVK